MAVWSDVNLLELSPTMRLDAEYYQPAFLENMIFLQRHCGFPVEQFGDALLSISGGATPLGADYPEDGVPFLRVQNIMQGYLSLDDVVYISPEMHLTQLKRSQLQPGDVLLTITGVSYGKAAFVPPNLGPANINQHSVRMEFKKYLRPEYVAMFLNCRFGKLQSDMKITGVTRPALDYGEISTFLIPVLPDALQLEVVELCEASQRQRARSLELYTEAESLLLNALGLSNLDTEHAIAYERNFREVAHGDRFDAAYFSPRAQRALEVMGRSGKTLGDVAPLAKRQFKPRSGEEFRYIEIGDLSGDGRAESSLLRGEEAPSRAQWIVRPHDVITSTVRPIRRLSALIEPEQDDFVCSSGFAVLQPRDVEPELLLVYLRAPIVCEILDLHTTATMYPAIATDVLLNIPFSAPDANVTAQIINKVRSSRHAHYEAQLLLESAKRHVEALIEGSA
ncbi:MAG TPA: hypothetical protein VGD58_19190 [Herpetosiphonaceae bacterium]